MTDNNVINFPRIGFNLTPSTEPAATPDSPVTAPPAAPDTSSSGTVRRSPLDAIAALRDPGLTEPVVTTPAAAGDFDLVPATFRNAPSAPAGPGSPQDPIGPRLGALSLAAILAVAVAALRGIHTAATTWRERRKAQQKGAEQAVASLASGSGGGKGKGGGSGGSGTGSGSGGGGKQRKVQPGHEYGRGLLNNLGGGKNKSGGKAGKGPTGGGKRPGGAGGPGRASKGSGKGSKDRHGDGNGPHRPHRSGGHGGDSKHGRKDRNRNGRGHHGAGGGTGKNHADGHHRKNKNPKAPHRGSQGGGHNLKKQQKNAGRDNRTRLPEALKDTTQKAAHRRLKKRRKNLDTPALWSNDPQAEKKGPKNKRHRGDAAAADKKSGKNRTNSKDRSSKKTTGDEGPDMSKLWDALKHDTKNAASDRWNRRKGGPRKPPVWKADDADDSTPSGGKPRKPKAKKDKKDRKAKKPGNGGRWERARDRARKVRDRWTPGPDFDGTGGASGTGSSTRRSPFENVGRATGATTWTVEREDYVGAQAKRWEPAAITPGTPALPSTGPAALDPAPAEHTARPGTTRPRPMPPAPSTPRSDRTPEARTMATPLPAQAPGGRRMHEQHATEITLDDACDGIDELTADAFAAHDESSRLAKKARSLRDTWIKFADDLADDHNLIGALFSAAAARFAESMDLIARMADEMETSSLEAAEKCETASNEMNDAYRPYNQAAADAGLSTPSAPIHNEA